MRKVKKEYLYICISYVNISKQIMYIISGYASDVYICSFP